MSYAQPADSGRKVTGFIVVSILHVVLIYALVNGLARKIVEVVQKPLETKLIEEVKAPPDKPPPPPPPKLSAPPPPFIPPPEVQIQVPQAAMQNAITAVSNVKPAEAASFTGPTRTAAVVLASSCDKPEYPPAALRAQETGVVTLRFLIDVDGKVLDSKVEHSSGSRRLDEAARRGLGLCKFKPATAGGRPEQSWARIDYEWKLE